MPRIFKKTKERKLFEELSKSDRNRVLDIQLKLFDDGYAKDAKFIQKECWLEALRLVLASPKQK